MPSDHHGITHVPVPVSNIPPPHIHLHVQESERVPLDHHDSCDDGQDGVAHIDWPVPDKGRVSDGVQDLGPHTSLMPGDLGPGGGSTTTEANGTWTAGGPLGTPSSSIRPK